jgi:dihydroneopterin aldolase
MATIALEGMRFYAYYGFYEEEQILGNDYVIDVYITTQTTRAAVNDDLQDTINYETIYLICEAVMRKKKKEDNIKLLETIAERISLDIRHQFKFISDLKVRVKKLNPPLGGKVEAAYIETEGRYSKKCARCSRPLLCYKDNTCWCMDTQVYQKTLEQMKTHYGDQCLCKNCLVFFAG